MLRSLLFAACLVSLLGSLCAQNCLPEKTDSPNMLAPVRQVTILNDRLLSNEMQWRIAEELRKGPRVTWSKQDISGLADEAADRVRVAYQNEGYFKVDVNARVARVAASSTDEYDIVVQVEDAGQQYQLGNLDITHVAIFPEPQLRDLFPVLRGEIFSRNKIAKGLEELRWLYLSDGYINFTPVASTMFDDATATVNLQVDVDEGKQFRLGNIEVIGRGLETRALIIDSLEIRKGDVYSSDSWQRLADRFPALSLDDPRVRNYRLNEKDGIVDIWLDFRKAAHCPSQDVVVDGTTNPN